MHFPSINKISKMKTNWLALNHKKMWESRKLIERSQNICYDESINMSLYHSAYFCNHKPNTFRKSENLASFSRLCYRIPKRRFLD